MPLKILIIHYRYYPVSGPERYLFNVKELFERNGHTVIPFSTNYDQNIETEYNKYFVDPIGDKSQFSYSKNSSISLKDKFKISRNYFYNKNVYKNLSALIKEEKPDVAYVLQFFGKLSIAVFDACKDAGIPVVLRLSDYGLLCSNNIFFRNNKVCTECLICHVSCIKHKCVHNSLSKSILNYSVLKFGYIRRFPKKIDSIVTPSIYMKRIFEGSNYFKENSIVHLPTFFLTSDLKGLHEITDTNYIDFCYFGRIEVDKGVDIFINALLILKEKGILPKVIIAGDINNSFAEGLINHCIIEKLDNVHFLGNLKKPELLKTISACRFSVLPSVWYDNMPNSLIESQFASIPVIASNIGSFPELIEDGYNGFLFNTGNGEDLAKKMEYAMSLNITQFEVLKENCLKWVNDYCSEDKHYTKLIALFNDVIFNSKNVR